MAEGRLDQGGYPPRISTEVNSVPPVFTEKHTTHKFKFRPADIAAANEDVTRALTDSYAQSPKGQKKGPEWAAKKGAKAAAKVDLTDPTTAAEYGKGKAFAIEAGLDDGPRRALAHKSGDTWVNHNWVAAGSEHDVRREFRKLSKSPVQHLVAVSYVQQATAEAAAPPVVPGPIDVGPVA